MLRSIKNLIREKLERHLGRDGVDFLLHIRNYVSAEFFMKALAFLSIPIFTRLLTPHDYGLLALYSSVYALGIVFLGLNLRASVINFYYESSAEFPRFLGAIGAFTLLFACAEGLLLFVVRRPLAGLFGIPPRLFVLAVLAAGLSLPFLLYQSYLQASKNSGAYNLLTTVKYTSTLVLSIGLVYVLQKNRYLGRVYVQIAVSAIVFAYVMYRLGRKAQPNLGRKHLMYSLLIALPLIPHTLSDVILLYFDRIMINRITGTSDAGLYSFALNIGLIMEIIAIGLNKSWVPIFFGKLRDGKHGEIAILARQFIRYCVFVGVALILFAPEAVVIMADKRYHVALSVVPVIVAAKSLGPLYTLYANFAFYRKKTASISICTLLAGGANVALNAVFIPRYGYQAAAFTTVASQLLLFLFHYINAAFILKERVVPLWKVLPTYLGIIAAIGVFYLLNGIAGLYLLKLGIKLALLLATGWFFFILISREKSRGVPAA